MLHGRFVHVAKTFNRFAIMGCELHQNAFGGRAPPGPAGGAYSAAPDSLSGLRGHLLYHIHDVASQNTVKMWLHKYK